MMMKNNTLVVLLAVLLFSVSGCKGSEDKGEAKGGSGMDKGQEFAFESGSKSLIEIKEKLGKGDFSVGSTCAGNLTYATKLEAVEKDEVKAFVKEIRQACNYDYPIAELEFEVKAAEAARAAEPEKGVLSECFNAKITMARKTLDKAHPGDEKVKALVARFEAVCPPKK